MSGEYLTRRISAALDTPGGLDDASHPDLRAEVERDPVAKKWAADVQTLDGLLQAWPTNDRTDEAWEGLAARIEQRLSEALPGGLDFTTPPFFDDEEAQAAHKEPSPAQHRTDAARRELDEKRAVFSLSQLSHLDAPKAVAPPPPPAGNPRVAVRPAVPVAPGAPPAKGPGLKPVAAPHVEERFTIPTFSSPIAPLPLLAAPPLAPEKPKRSPWLLLGGASVAAAAIVLLAVLAVRGLSSDPSTVGVSAAMIPLAAEQAAPASPSPAPSAGAAPAATGDVPAAPAQPAVEAPAEPAAAPAAPDAPLAQQSPSPGATAPLGGAVPSGTARRTGAGASSARSPAAPHAAGGARNVGEAASAATALRPAPVAHAAGAVGGGGSAPTGPHGGAPAAAAGAGAQDTPSRADVVSAMGSVRVAVAACAQGRSGLAQVRVTFSGPSGRVMMAVVEGQFAGTPQGSCIARAVRAASVPRFAQPTFGVSFPFQL